MYASRANEDIVAIYICNTTELVKNATTIANSKRLYKNNGVKCHTEALSVS